MKANESVLQTLREQGVIVRDWSILSTFIWCPRGFKYRHHLGLIRADAEIASAMEFGSGCHLAIQNWYASNKDDASSLKIFVNYFRPFEEQPKIGKRGLPLATTYSLIFGCSLLSAYFDKWRADSSKLIENEITVAEEVSDGHFLCGKIDRMFERPQGIVYHDTKTTKYYKDYLLNPNPQFMGYKFLCQKLTGQNVQGELDMLGVSKSDSIDNLIRREPFDYSDHQMNEWRKSFVMWSGLVDKCEQSDNWPQSWNCKPYFRDCAYLPLCTVPVGTAHDKLLATMYVEKRWDPFSKQEEV